jgi:hypothetical protein
MREMKDPRCMIKGEVSKRDMFAVAMMVSLNSTFGVVYLRRSYIWLRRIGSLDG